MAGGIGSCPSLQPPVDILHVEYERIYLRLSVITSGHNNSCWVFATTIRRMGNIFLNSPICHMPPSPAADTDGQTNRIWLLKQRWTDKSQYSLLKFVCLLHLEGGWGAMGCQKWRSDNNWRCWNFLLKSEEMAPTASSYRTTGTTYIFYLPYKRYSIQYSMHHEPTMDIE